MSGGKITYEHLVSLQLPSSAFHFWHSTLKKNLFTQGPSIKGKATIERFLMAKTKLQNRFQNIRND